MTVAITRIAAVPSRLGPLRPGDQVIFTLTVDSSVAVAGLPELSLGNGGLAIFQPLSSSDTSLVFAYTVAAGQDSPNLGVTGLLFNGGTISGGGGTVAFAPGTLSAAGTQPSALAVADLNGDGVADIIVPSLGTGVSVLFGQGGGLFAPAIPYYDTSVPAAVAVGDLNGDGRPDVVTADFGGAGGLAVRLNDGTGTLGAPTVFAPGDPTTGVTAADLDHDGKLDLVFATLDLGVGVMLGDGHGGFSAPSYVVTGREAYSVAVADVNGDGNADVIVGDFYGGLSVLLGDGHGGLGAPAFLAAGSSVLSVAVADLNGDGIADIVAADHNGGVDVLLGTGAGAFAPAVVYDGGNGPESVAVADVDGDGRPDLVVADYRGDGFSVLLNAGGGRFGPAIRFASPTNPTGIVTADVNGDGRPDVLVSNLSGGVSVLLNTSSGGPLATGAIAALPGAVTGLVIDTTPPVVTLALLADTGASSTDRITRNAALTGTGEAGGLVTITSGATVLGTTTVDQTGAWSFAPSLADGSYTLVASEADAAGNIGTASIAITLDTVAPGLTMALLNDTGSSATDRITTDPTLKGTGLANTRVTITNGAAVVATTTANVQGNWSVTPAGLAAGGTYNLLASETDIAGNTGSTSLAFTIDRTTIAGTRAAQATNDYTAVKPFAATVVSALDTGNRDTLTITLKDATGLVTDADGTLSGAGLTRIATGTYALAAATPSALTSAVQALTFTPRQQQVAAGRSVTTSFTLSVGPAAGGPALAVDATTSVTATALNPIDGFFLGFGLIVDRSGDDLITTHGSFNTVVDNAGNDLIVLSGAFNQVLGAANNGNVTVTGAPGGATSVTLGNGNNVVQLGGLMDTIRLGDGNNVVSGTQGMAFISTGSGNDTIVVGGRGNTINAGGGVNTITGGQGNDTFVLAAAGKGVSTIGNFSLSNADVLDVRAAMAATAWNRSSSTLANYLKVTSAGGNTTLAIAPAGGGAATVIATLQNSGSVTLQGLISNNALLTV